MAAKRTSTPKRPVIEVGWYLREWMDKLKIRQAAMCERTGWNKTTMSHLYNRQQDYSPELVRQAAKALKIAEHELLLPPLEAEALRNLRESALTIAAETRKPWRGPENL